jgi:hypothetical protein
MVARAVGLTSIAIFVVLALVVLVSHHTNQGTAELPGTELAAGSTCPCTGSCRKDSRNWMKNIQSANQAVYSKANVRSTKCDNYCAKTGCGWTNQYKCPWDTRKNIPFAGDDGGLGFECCCKVQKIQGMCGYFDASNAEIAALEANLKVPYAPAAAQTGAKAILGPIIGMFSMMAAGPMGLASPIPVGPLISGLINKVVDTLGKPKNPKPNPLTAKFKDLTENMIALSKKISEETTKKAIGALSLTQIKNKIWTSGCETQKLLSKKFFTDREKAVMMISQKANGIGAVRNDFGNTKVNGGTETATYLAGFLIPSAATLDFLQYLELFKLGYYTPGEYGAAVETWRTAAKIYRGLYQDYINKNGNAVCTGQALYHGGYKYFKASNARFEFSCTCGKLMNKQEWKNPNLFCKDNNYNDDSFYNVPKNTWCTKDGGRKTNYPNYKTCQGAGAVASQTMTPSTFCPLNAINSNVASPVPSSMSLLFTKIAKLTSNNEQFGKDKPFTLSTEESKMFPEYQAKVVPYVQACAGARSSMMAEYDALVTDPIEEWAQADPTVQANKCLQAKAGWSSSTCKSAMKYCQDQKWQADVKECCTEKMTEDYCE